jgi:O-antigen/teichoic acid export membrane protein
MNAEAVYLRSHKREVLTPYSILFGIANLVMARALAPHYGAVWVCIGYMLNSFIFGFGLITWIFLRKRKEWHQNLEPSAAEFSLNPLQ